MSSFHPLYNFIPVSSPTATVAYQQIAAGNSEQPIRHDMWQKGAYSGRLILEIHLDTPTVVGGQQEPSAQPNGPSTVKPYCRSGKPAIPGNSLRGMIGSVAETLSQSALRILEDKTYSVRKPIDSGLSLSAIGMLRTSKSGTSQFELLPLTIPVQAAQTREGSYQLAPLWQQVFNDGRTELKYCLPAYIEGYETVGSGDDARQQVVSESFLGKNQQLECFFGVKTAEKKPTFYYARLVDNLTQPVGDKIVFHQEPLKTIDTNHKHFLLGQKISQHHGIEDIITAARFEQLSELEQAQYTKGVLRILGIAGREQAIPHTKKRELFIPVHQEQRLPIPNQVIDNFIKLGTERDEASEGQYPFKPQGYQNWQPQAGQLVFFNIAPDEAGQIYVSEISLSAVWRKLVTGSSHDFFRKINPDLLPWNPDRDELTPAECLFGVVEEDKNPANKQARALASRLRFSDACPVTDEVLLSHPVTLKVLSSPKPPCPAMYFHHDQERQRSHIAKTDLTSQKHRPNGRKVYLHHPRQHLEKKGKYHYWESRESEHLDQKMRCQPLQSGQTFYGHLDFDNLSQAELGLVLRSLYPDSTYRHRLGLGKALGLGTVAVTIAGLFLIDRLQRYSLQGLDGPRYHQVLRGTTPQPSPPPWAKFYSLEAQVLAQASTNLLDSAFYRDSTLINQSTLAVLQTVGNPDALKPDTPVSPPLLVEQRNSPELETFAWFAENDKPNKQAALPIIEAGKKLPTLNQWNKR